MSAPVVVSAGLNGVYLSSGCACSWAALRAAANQCSMPYATKEYARQVDPEGAALEDAYAELLGQARALCPPTSKQYHDACDHQGGVCRPVVKWLDVDQLRTERESNAQQYRTGREIEALRAQGGVS